MTYSRSETDIIDAVQLQDPGSALVVLYDIEYAPGKIAYFTSQSEEDGAPVFFKDPFTGKINEYFGIPIEADGFDVTGAGAYNRPQLKIGNIGSSFAYFTGGMDYADLIGTRVTRRMTLEKYLCH